MNKEKHKKRLKNCPIGLFDYKGIISLKTEYYDPDGYSEYFTADGGEYFWGENDLSKQQRDNLLVTPTSIDEIETKAYRNGVKEVLKDVWDSMCFTYTAKDNDTIKAVSDVISQMEHCLKYIANEYDVELETE